MQSKQYYVYIMTTYKHTVLYTGFTENLIKRTWQHKNHVSADGFTAKFNVNKLVYYEIYTSPIEAINREKYIKNLLRKKKIDLINNFNPEWIDLYENII